MTDQPAWRPLFERSVQAFYDGALTEGREACERLLSLSDLPDHIVELTRQNLTHYAIGLPDLAPTATFHRLDIPVAPGWSRFNPSIAATPDGFRVLIRSSNYWVEKGRIAILGQSDVVRTAYSVADLDASLAVRRVVPVVDETEPAGRFPTWARDYEDCRLIAVDGEWFAVGATRERNPDAVSQAALLRFADNAFRDLRLLSDAADGRDERNWMPAATPDGALRFIYSCGPTVALQPDAATGVVEAIRHPAPPLARWFRGGSQLLPVDDGYLCVIHEGIDFEGPARTYLHRWVSFDAAFRIDRISPPFYFLYRGTEYCAGMARDGDHLLLSFGLDDREAFLARLPLADALASLAPPFAVDQTLDDAERLAPPVEALHASMG
ncbi:MAG TPA: hypothetical protein VFU81_18730 [Thermomicrobiales bacterium]|nr:hypothetical protein [Thermomicrobiales bacterium]